MEQGQLWRQYIIAGVANFATASTGFCMAWMVPIIPLLLSDESPLLTRLHDSDVAVLSAVTLIGTVIGPAFGGLLSAKLGRRWGLLAAIVPLLVGWVLVGIGTHILLLYVGRVCGGIATGMFFTIVPLYCTEIATDNSRGALGSLIELFANIGVMFAHGVGTFAPYRVTAFVGLAGVAVTGILFFFMPETPTYNLLKGDREAAAESLMKIRGRSRAGVEAELSLISADVTASSEKKATFGDVFKGKNCKAFYISCALVFAQQLSGIIPVLFYTTFIFISSGLILSKIFQSMIVVAVEIAASFITPLVVDRLGRRVLLIISTCGTAIGLVLLGTFFALEAYEIRIPPSMSKVPVVALMLFILSFSWGLGPLPLVMMSELLPVEVKMMASSIVNTLRGILPALISMILFPWFAGLGMYWLFFICCACSVLSFFFVVFVVPETKGKNYREIQETLSGGNQTQETLELQKYTN